MWWEVFPGPFEMLRPEERDAYLSRWVRWLQALPGPAWVHVFTGVETLGVDGEEFAFLVSRFYVEGAPEADPSAAGLEARPVGPVERRPVVREYGDRLLLGGGVWARVYVVYGLPKVLPEGFLSELYGTASEVHIHLEPVDPGRVVGGLEARRRRLEGLAAAYSNVALRDLYASLEALLRAAMGYGRLLRVTVLLVASAPSPGELRGACARLEALLKSRLLRFQAPLRVQGALYGLRLRDTVLGFGVRLARPLLVDSGSALVLYPFISEELHHPGGVYLGVDRQTGAPVVFDPYRMPNYNFVVIGETGSGKSMTAKVYIRRWWRRYGHPVIIVDPEGEYARVAEDLVPGLPVHRIDPGRGAGLDPLRLASQRLIPYEAAVDVLAEYYSVPPEHRGELAEQALRSGSVEELLTRVSGDLARYLAPAGGVDAWVYRGAPLAPGGRGAVYDLSGVESGSKKILVGSLLAAMLSTGLRSRALLVVDEGWMFSQYPAIMQLLADVSRRGRKRGVNFLFLTQRPADVLRNDAGRTILEQSSTVLLLRLGEASLEAIRGLYRLSDAETTALLEARPGEGVLRAGPWRLSIYIQPTREELRSFSTRPL